jgi:hypothetical protein
LTEDRAFGADDVAGALYTGQRLRKLRFLMTDNSPFPGWGVLAVLVHVESVRPFVMNLIGRSPNNFSLVGGICG